MWYTSILQSQAKKICKSNMNMAERFITHLVDLIETKWDYEFELMAILGFIKDLYLFAENNKYRDVSLSEFSRVCMGLLILHVKYADDYVVRVSDFIPLCKDEIIFTAMDIQNEVNGLISSIYNGHRLQNTDRSLSSRSFQRTFAATPNKILLKILLGIENEVFWNLDHNVSVNVDQLILIFRLLIAEANDPHQLVSQLLFFLEILENKDEKFDELIFELRKSEEELLPRVVHEICLQLEEYLTMSKPHSNLRFFCCLRSPSPYDHSRDITEIVKNIKQKELQNIDNIFEKLYEIEIISPKDKLIDTIQFLETKYRTHICQI
ncbi:DNA repair protein [Legionella sainthelensi]|nr:DNA repair protein [Legionella sainthelensi]